VVRTKAQTVHEWAKFDVGKGHSGVEGNEAAGKRAKAAITIGKMMQSPA